MYVHVCMYVCVYINEYAQVGTINAAISVNSTYVIAPIALRGPPMLRSRVQVISVDFDAYMYVCMHVYVRVSAHSTYV
jgi:hypothetical protein